jgi:hypothetical protein
MGPTHLYRDIGTPGTIVPFGEWSEVWELGAESAGI